MNQVTSLAFDASILQQPRYTGCQIYTHYILKELPAIAPPQVQLHYFFMMDGWNPRIDELVSLPNVIVHRTQGRLERLAKLPFTLRRIRARAYYIMNGSDGMVHVPLGCPSLALVHDLRQVLHPELAGGSEVARLYRERAKHWIGKRERIVTGAEQVKREIVEAFGVAPERVVVAPEATDHIAPTQTAERPEVLPAGAGFFLMFNIGDPVKNWNYAFRAFDRYIQEHPDDTETQLVIGGSLRGEEPNILHDLATLPRVKERTLLTGYVSDAERAYLYQNAWCLLFPSLYEGFGIPSLEAMGLGLPTLLSDIPVFREVAADAALYSPLDSPEAMARNMHRVVADASLRTQLIADGKKRAAQFSWKASAEKTLHAMLEVAAGR